MENEKNKIDLLYDHYKDTYLHIRDYLKLRDKIFFFVLVFIAIMLFQVYSPITAEKTFSEILSDKIGLKQPIDFSFITSLIWFSLLALLIRYFQTIIHIERQYDYIRMLEDKLSSYYGNDIFTREGKSYLKNYPIFSNWTWIIYTIIYPFLFIFIVSFKICNEFESFNLHFFINLLFYLSIVITVIFYLLLLHFKK